MDYGEAFFLVLLRFFLGFPSNAFIAFSNVKRITVPCTLNDQTPFRQCPSAQNPITPYP